MDREVIDDWLKHALTFFVVAVLVFAPVAFGAVRTEELVIVQWILLAVGAVWLARLWLKPRLRLLFPPAAMCVLPFLGYAVWRYTGADIEYVARREVLLIGFAALLYFAVLTNLNSQKRQTIILTTMIVVATMISMYGVYQWLSGSEAVFGFGRTEAYHGRGSGTYINPNHFAGLLELILPAAVALLTAGKATPLFRVFLGYGCFVLLAGLAASGSRAGWTAAMISVGLTLGFLVIRRGQVKLTIVALIAICVVGGWLYKRGVESRAQETVLTGHQRDVRLRLWNSALLLWKDHLWLGVGPAHFDARYRGYREAMDKMQARPGNAHNDYLNTLADYGLCGLVLLLLPLAVAGLTAASIWPHLRRDSSSAKSKGSQREAIAVGTGCGLIAALIHSLLDFSLHIPANLFAVSVIFAIFTSQVRFATNRWWLGSAWAIRVAGTVVLAGAGVVLGGQTLRQTRESQALRAAARANDGSLKQLTALKEAYAIEPHNPETTYAIGERHRARAWLGRPDSDQETREAMQWFERGMKLNRWDPFNYIRYGMCLDFLERHDEALAYFEKALKLDPNYYQTRAMMAWHYYQVEDFEAANEWNEKSIQVNWTSNEQALAYRPLIARAIAAQKSKQAARAQLQ